MTLPLVASKSVASKLAAPLVEPSSSASAMAIVISASVPIITLFNAAPALTVKGDVATISLAIVAEIVKSASAPGSISLTLW